MATTTALAAEVEPQEVGFDPERLARLDAYLDGFRSEGTRLNSSHSELSRMPSSA